MSFAKFLGGGSINIDHHESLPCCIKHSTALETSIAQERKKLFFPESCKSWMRGRTKSRNGYSTQKFRCKYLRSFFPSTFRRSTLFFVSRVYFGVPFANRFITVRQTRSQQKCHNLLFCPVEVTLKHENCKLMSCDSFSDSHFALVVAAAVHRSAS